MPKGIGAPRRQGAVSACTSGSDIAPLLVGGYYESSPTAVNNLDVVWLHTDSYGNLMTVPLGYDDSMEGTLLAACARTATCASDDQTNYNARGVTVWLDVESNSGSETLTLQIQSKNPVTASYTTLLESASITATGDTVYVVYPIGGSGVGAVEDYTESVSLPLPRTWRVNVVADSGSSMTYSVGYSYTL
ncbi:MAG: hypothetical protein GWN58_08135 [Anaerolineae bacterium]|nr:hypothetical protein [Anaerolineae bacterium]